MDAIGSNDRIQQRLVSDSLMRPSLRGSVLAWARTLPEEEEVFLSYEDVYHEYQQTNQNGPARDSHDAFLSESPDQSVVAGVRF